MHTSRPAALLGNGETCFTEIDLTNLNIDQTSSNSADGLNVVKRDVVSPGAVKIESPTQNLELRKQIKIYGIRWYILAIFSSYVTLQYFIWNTFGPIASSVKKVYSWENSDVATLANWDTILYVIFAMQLCWLVQEKGLRKTFIISLMFVVTGGVFKCIASVDNRESLWLMNTGQILNGFGGVLAQAAGPFISNTWFPPNERTTATAIATLTAQFGLAMSFIIGPLIVQDLPVDHQLINATGNLTSVEIKDQNIEAMMEEIVNFLIIELGIAILLLVTAMIYFPNKPELPPSASASLPKIDFRGGFQQLIYQKHFWLILIITSSVTGIYSGWGAVMYLNFKDSALDISQRECGWIGFTTTIFSVAGGVILGYISDRFPGHIRMHLMVLFTIACAAFTYVALVCQHSLPYSTGALYVACLLGGFCINGSIPLMYEITIELTYPVPETVSIGLLGVVNNIFTFSFLLLLNVPDIGVRWMNWTLLGTCVVSLILLGIFREQYGRMEVDQSITIATIDNNLNQDYDTRGIIVNEK